MQTRQPTYDETMATYDAFKAAADVVLYASRNELNFEARRALERMQYVLRDMASDDSYRAEQIQRARAEEE